MISFEVSSSRNLKKLNLFTPLLQRLDTSVCILLETINGDLKSLTDLNCFGNRSLLWNPLFKSLRNDNRLCKLEKINLSGCSQLLELNIIELNDSAKSLKEFRPCLKMYLFDHVRSRITRIPSDEWYKIILLPTEKFANVSEKKVWQDSLDIINK